MSSKSIDFPPAARISCVYARRCIVCLGITQKAASSSAAARTAAHFLWLKNGAKNTNLYIYIISCIVWSGCLHKGASKQKLGHFWQRFFSLFISFLVGSTVAEASSTHCSLRKHMQIDNLMMCFQTSNQARHCCSYLTDNPMEDGYTPGPPQSNFSQLSCIRSSAVSSNECSPCCEALDYKELKWQAHFRLTGSVESRQTGKHVSVTHRHPWPP